jgi:predicted metal-dependent phosphoesterase TrpH
MIMYKYETHAHTSEISLCGKISAADLVRFYKQQGYKGIFITDHFITGNTTVPKDLPWKTRIDMYCKGFENAYAEGKRIGIDVFFGWEHSFQGTDFLTYGLDKEWLYEHPELEAADLNTYSDIVRASGGFVVHAHPFREAGYISMIRLLPRKVDAVETDNSCRTDFENFLANQYAENYGLLKFAGSDNHRGPLPRLAGIQVAEPLKTETDPVDAIKSGKFEMFSLINNGK